jgi:hypothetical protein
MLTFGYGLNQLKNYVHTRKHQLILNTICPEPITLFNEYEIDIDLSTEIIKLIKKYMDDHI